MQLFHFSHDPAIERFVPHVPASSPTNPPLVWAIDEIHQSAYWFPRLCPRVTVWPRDAEERAAFCDEFHTEAGRVHAVELRWLQKMSAEPLYRYTLPPSAFRPWPDAAGYWVAESEVVPEAVEPMPDLISCHVDAAIELRGVPCLWRLRDRVVRGPWEFSIIRFANASPRLTTPTSGSADVTPPTKS